MQMVSMFFIGLRAEHSRKPIAGGLTDSAQKLGLRRGSGNHRESQAYDLGLAGWTQFQS